MRRVVAVAPAAARDPVRALLASLPGITARVVDSLDDVPWPDTDCLWLHDLHPTSPALRAWLDAGGRVLATLDGALVAVELGLETSPPDDIRNALWEAVPGQDPSRGLAAFGHHPLFDGMQQGASTWAPGVGESYRWAVYLARRPSNGVVVAVERTGLELNPSRIVAWEYAVGNGGLLCIGSSVCPEAADQRCAAQLGAVVGNALAGHGIPHRDRPAGARHWPRPGERVVRRDLDEVPEVPEPRGDWAASSVGLVREPPVEADDTPWALAGRRGFMRGERSQGLREAWLHPFRVLRDAALTIGGSAPSASRLRVTPDQVDRHSSVDGVEVTERWTLALEHPVMYWQVDPGTPRPVLLEWTVDLRRAWPYPAGSGGDLELSVAPGGRSALLGAAGDPFRLLIDLEGGTLEAAPVDGPAVRLSVRATGPCRIRLMGAADETDLERSRQMLGRRGFAGLRAQRAEHALELATYATSIDAPEPGLVEAFEWAKVRMDAALVGTPGVGRCLTTGYGESVTGSRRDGGAVYAGAEACRTAVAQLAAGDRGGPRDTLKFLSLTQNVDGRILEDCSTSGLASYGGGSAVPWYLLLAGRYASWTGELDFLARRWVSIRKALEAAVAEQAWTAADAGGWATALEALQPLAEALGHPEAAEDLSVHAASARAAASAGVDSFGWPCIDAFESGRFEEGLAEWRALAPALHRPAGDALAGAGIAVAAIEGLWGVKSNALEGAVRLAPWFPAAWDTMALDRLRVGKTVLSVRLRRRFGQVSARLERVYGPRLHVDIALRGEQAAAAVTLDDVELRGGRVAFEAEGNHALVWHA